MRRSRICPDGAQTAIFVEGGDEERLVQAAFAPLRTFLTDLL